MRNQPIVRTYPQRTNGQWIRREKAKSKVLSIAMVTDDFLPAGTGVGVHVQKIAAELAGRGHRVLVITSRRSGQPAEETWNGVQIYRVFSLPIWGFYQALPSRSTLRRILLENKVDIVHFHYISFLMLRALKVARDNSIKVFYTAHMTIDHLTQPFFLKPFRGFLEKRYNHLCNQFDDMICVSSEQALQMQRAAPRARVIYMSNPIDFDGSAPILHRPDRFVVLFAGRLDPEKNVGYLLKGFKVLADQYPNVELWIAGKGVQRDELGRQATAGGLARKVSFLGHISHTELAKRYAAADVFVLPSLVETQGMVALEAMKFRRPVIVTNRIISARELVEDGVNGYIVEPDSVQDLAEKLITLHDNPSLREKMGEAGFQKTPGETTQSLGDKLEQLYKNRMPVLTPDPIAARHCTICGHTEKPLEGNLVRSNIRQYRDERFGVWRCRSCQSIHSDKVKNLDTYYNNYPLHRAKLGYFSRAWYGIFLKRLVRAGLKKEHSLLDYGCGQGLFLDYLKERGYAHCFGFDPYVAAFKNKKVLKKKFDWVVGMDVIEHDFDPKTLMAQLANLLTPTGRLCLQTPNASEISLSDPEKHLHSLHAPYHLHILSWKGLETLGRNAGLKTVFSSSRYFVDSWLPGTSWSFIRSLIHHSGNDFDVCFEPPRLSVFLSHPSLLLKFFFGYFCFPKERDQMMMIFSISCPPAPSSSEIDQTIPARIQERALKNPLGTAFWYQQRGVWISKSWKDYWTHVEKIGSIIHHNGLIPGERVAIVLPTSMEWELLDKAALCLGLVVVGLEPHMAWDTMATVLKEIRPTAVFTESKEMALKISSLLGQTQKLLVCLEECTSVPPLMDWNRFMLLSEKILPMKDLNHVSPSSPATLFLTSETTGTPKGIVYSHEQLLLAARSITSAMGPFRKEDRSLAWLPMANPFQRNMNLVALLAGIPLYFWEDPKRIQEALCQVQPTILIGVPWVFEKVYQSVLARLRHHRLGFALKALLNVAMDLAPKSSQAKVALSWYASTLLALNRRIFTSALKSLGGRMRFMVAGSGPCRQEVLLFFHALGVPLLEAYGTSECAVPISMNRPHDYKIGTVGRPLENIELYLEEEEVEVRSPGLFKGYENQRVQTNLTSGQFLSTGDIGQLDEEGYLTLLGRGSAMTKTSTGRKEVAADLEERWTT